MVLLPTQTLLAPTKRDSLKDLGPVRFCDAKIAFRKSSILPMTGTTSQTVNSDTSCYKIEVPEYFCLMV